MAGTQGFLAMFTIAVCFLLSGAQETVCSDASLADIVFIVDESGSIGNDNFQLVRDFIHNIVDGLNVGLNSVRVGIVLYSDQASAQVFLNSFQEKTEMLTFIKMLPYRGGGTKTGKALEFARTNIFIREQGSRKQEGVQQVAIVITDGQSQDNVSSPAAALRRAGVTVYALGIKDANKKELTQIASHPTTKNVFKVDSFVNLKTLEMRLKNSLFYNILQRSVKLNERAFTAKKSCVETGEADIYFLIDQSGSIEYPDFDDMKNFMNEFLGTFRIGQQHVRVGVVKFSDLPTLEFDLTTYSDKDSLVKAVNGIKQLGGGTQTGKALESMGPHFVSAKASRGHEVREFLILITDGESQDKVRDQAKHLRDQNIIIYAIGVKEANETQLLEIAGSEEKMFNVNNFDALKPIKNEIITNICFEDICKDMQGDVIFLIDSSGSINPEDFNKMKKFMESIINKSTIGLNEVRVGVIQFSDKQDQIFPLNEYYKKADMVQSIEAMTQLGGGTLTGKALSFTSQFFDPARGGRTNVRQMLIVVTDGEAQDKVLAPAKEIQDKGVKVYAIGVGNAKFQDLLEISGNRARVYSEVDFDALGALESQLVLGICDIDKDCVRTEVADIIFLVDGSSSISPQHFTIMKNFMMALVNETTVGEKQTRFGLIVFSDKPESKFTLNSYTSRREVNTAISKLKAPTGDTYTGKALKYSLGYFGKEYGGRKALKVPQWLMVITDGEATDPDDLKKPSEMLRDNGIVVFSIGVVGANKDELETMAGDPARVFFVDSFHELETLHKNISIEFCNNIKPVCMKEMMADIVFLVDGSESIGMENFQQMRQFLFTLVTSFDVAPDKVRIGLVQYSTTPRTEFLFNTFSEKQNILDYINELPYKGGGTMIGEGLDFLLNELFVPRAGSRINDNVPQIAVVITDGQSQDNVELHALELQKRGITLYAIGIKDADEEELEDIATKPFNQHVFRVSGFEALQGISQSIVQGLCTTVEEAKRQITHVDRNCSSATVADIVFLVDGSTSISPVDFQVVQMFLRRFIEGLDIGSDKVRVGLAQFSDEPKKEFL
ncbi:hypothetical protein DPEC_G00141080 [Dallia pectoralis]|uniref:Uncharacterized protein n=1 Tax=Dallia pectoralis TaxID=75939 RepID=A0ACC2GML1_DALPE|nr:hypothetical protein DPEC_G00141080 [Dallia pectoralis]